MIVSRIIGGLGNQMFQYAVGRVVSASYNTAYSLQVSDFLGYRLHNGFELKKVFNCPIPISSDLELSQLLGWQSPQLLRKILLKKHSSLLRKDCFIVEPFFHYWDGINSIPVNSYLAGYWLSYKYFENRRELILKDFSFKLPLLGENKKTATTISQVNSISLHVRRGDYISNPKNTATHGVCPIGYYQKSIEYISKKVNSPQFFVFSDDIVWASNNLKFTYPVSFISNNSGVDSHFDMQLMSLCRHNIISNSTFSWWGAWLNENKAKIVIAPKDWLANKNEVSDYERFMVDLIPNEWITL